MIVCPQNNLIVQVDHAYISNISNILRVSAIENNSSVDPSDLVNIMGEVISIPKSITTDKRGYEGFSTKDIQVGDIAIFRFDVIYEFKMLSKTERTYRNRIWYNAQEYWLCDIQKVFGVVRNGEIRMVNGYVMISDFKPPKIVLSQSNQWTRDAQNSEIMHIGSPKTTEKQISATRGDKIYFNPISAAKYQINGKPFCVIQQDKLFGKQVN